MRVASRILVAVATAAPLALAGPACGERESPSGEGARAEAGAPAEGSERAEVTLRDPTGETVGSATLRASPNGVLLRAELRRAPPGEHALHIHQTGACEAPDFASAGGHLNPAGVGHGFLDGDGVHAGDLPNVHVPASGELRLDLFAPGVELEEHLFDGDGAALVMHEGPDDYRTNPAGAAGPRIACGVIARP